MGQTWRDLLFAHWNVPPETLEQVVPRNLPLDTRDGKAWVGVTPFAVRDLRLRLTFPVPFVSAFPEINVRTYVKVGDKPGIYFFSLDADSALAVATARRFYRLPYFRSEAAIERTGGRIRYQSARTSRDAPRPADFRASYWPVGETFQAPPGSREHWLTERYCLYTLDDRGRVLRADIHHPPWALQTANAEIDTNTMGAELGLELEGEPLLHYARWQDVVFWNLELAGRAEDHR